MVDRNIHLLLKFFCEESHADAFMQGALYTNTLGFFKGLEEQRVALRADPNEGVSHWWQPKDISRFTLSSPQFGEILIPNDDLGGPVSTSMSIFDDLRVFCMTAIYTTGVKMVGNQLIEDTPHNPPLEEVFHLSDKLLEFGDYVVVVEPRRFIEAVRQDLKNAGHQAAMNLVQYYDPTTFSGKIPDREVPFQKQNAFAYQREFRICMRTKLISRGPLLIPVSDLRTFCTKIKTRDFNQRIKLIKDAS